jgi:NTE family protein
VRRPIALEVAARSCAEEESNVERKRIAIACQGGGSQCAFVAGALKALFKAGIDERFNVVGLSGTSGGALTAALAWKGLLLKAHGDRTPIEDRIIACWKDLSAQTPQEMALDSLCTQFVRMAEHGFIPTYAQSPSSFGFRMWAQAASTWIGRPEFTDLRALITKHLDLEPLPAMVEEKSPVLLLGAGDIMEGTLKIFSSAKGEISIDALLASAAIPNLFPAVLVDGHAYWDGIFASNPPVIGFLQPGLVAAHPVPEEIWIIQVNRPQHSYIPDAPNEISNRRNHLAGNLSLQHELQVLDIMNILLAEGALTPRFRARFGMETAERITVRFIRMSRDLQYSLDYPSKLSRLGPHIDRLLADGETQGAAFLEELEGPQPVQQQQLETLTNGAERVRPERLS